MAGRTTVTIEPLVYNPTWTRTRLFSEASARILAVARLWAVPVPEIYDFSFGLDRVLGGGSLYGEYKLPNRLYVNVARATSPAKSRGRIWSYPCHKTDRTCSGILAHEFGHHCQAHRVVDRTLWRQIVSSTKPVTGYEPTSNEAWAESIRIFVWNPDLLRVGRPQRYEYIIRYFQPWHTLNWREVLTNAPEFIIQNAEAWIQTGKTKTRSLLS